VTELLWKATKAVPFQWASDYCLIPSLEYHGEQMMMMMMMMMMMIIIIVFFFFDLGRSQRGRFVFPLQTTWYSLKNCFSFFFLIHPKIIYSYTREYHHMVWNRATNRPRYKGLFDLIIKLIRVASWDTWIFLVWQIPSYLERTTKSDGTIYGGIFKFPTLKKKIKKNILFRLKWRGMKIKTWHVAMSVFCCCFFVFF